MERNEDNYYDNKNIKTMKSFKELSKVLGYILLASLLFILPVWLTISIIIIASIYYFRTELDLSKNHKIHIKLDSYGSIQVFDNSLDLIAILYKDRTIEYKRECSFFKMVKIKNVSDHFEDYEYNLKIKGDSICL